MSRDEAIKKAYEAFIYERGEHLATTSAIIGTMQGEVPGKEIAHVGGVRDTRPEGSHVAIATVAMGRVCDCCEDTPLRKMCEAIYAISTGKLPRCHFTSLVLPVDGGVEIVTYGLDELWTLKVSMDADGQATKWEDIHAEDSQILPALDTYLRENPQYEKGWRSATQSKFKTQTLQHNGTAI